MDRIYDDPNLDLVDVCLPTPLHADHVIRALHAGKHVLCELPLASTMADAQGVSAVAETIDGVEQAVRATVPAARLIYIEPGVTGAAPTPVPVPEGGTSVPPS